MTYLVTPERNDLTKHLFVLCGDSHTYEATAWLGRQTFGLGEQSLKFCGITQSTIVAHERPDVHFVGGRGTGHDGRFVSIAIHGRKW